MEYAKVNLSRNVNHLENACHFFYQWATLHELGDKDDSIDKKMLLDGEYDLIKDLRRQSMGYFLSNLYYIHAVNPNVFFPFDVFQLWLEQATGNELHEDSLSMSLVDVHRKDEPLLLAENGKIFSREALFNDLFWSNYRRKRIYRTNKIV